MFVQVDWINDAYQNLGVPVITVLEETFLDKLVNIQ